MATIDNVHVAENLTALWGVKAYEYKIDGVQIDFQDLMVAVSEKRAVAIEGEIAPLTTKIRARNKTLEDLGNVLADLTRLQSKFKSEESGDTRHDSLNQSSKDILLAVFGKLDWEWLNMTKSEIEEWIQKVKSKIDALNNLSQSDMSRLQSIVDRRDESYSTATNLMTAISDSRSNLIRNL